ncbi:GAP family protein [Arthrobacter sp. 260]|uniref:GAP family protein n=1 Tax=Arthrobacter sp. 260 TaxID=2735314 RepID=UPI001491F993|nr:GAP family protein [Arthrobacter sp. 260]NOJ61181.1 hypothetical protein [Arthrobacter sp. 260]
MTALGLLIPIAVAVAISTVPILVGIGLLLSETGSSSPIAYLIGWVTGLFAVAALFSLGLSAASPANAQSSLPFLGTAEILIGVALGTFGMTMIFRKSTPGTTPWIDRMSRIGPLPAAGVGMVLNLRPKALLLAAAAGLAIGTARLTVAEAAIALATYTAIGCVTVAIPIVLTLARPDAMKVRLRVLLGWLQRNQRIVTGIVLIMIGAVVLGNGLTHLAT